MASRRQFHAYLDKSLLDRDGDLRYCMVLRKPNGREPFEVCNYNVIHEDTSIRYVLA